MKCVAALGQAAALRPPGAAHLQGGHGAPLLQRGAGEGEGKHEHVATAVCLCYAGQRTRGPLQCTAVGGTPVPERGMGKALKEKATMRT